MPPAVSPDDFFSSASPVYRLKAPARVNLLGEHIDYCGGHVMPAAIDRYTTLSFQDRHDRQIRCYAKTFNQLVEYSLDSAIQLDQQPSWLRYVAGVLQQFRPQMEHGLNLSIESSIPMGAGLSSSAALEVVIASAMARHLAVPMDPLVLAKLCQKVERDFAGVNCGLMDQAAVHLSHAGAALFLDCRREIYSYLPFPKQDIAIAIVDSGKPRSLAESAYNAIRAECDEALRLLRENDGVPYEALCDVPSISCALPDILQRRAEHVIGEEKRVQQAREALACGDIKGFGQLMSKSHRSLSDTYGVSCRELDTIAEIAAGVPEIYGAKMSGAGFGGVVVALGTTNAVNCLRTELDLHYNARTGRQASVHHCAIVDGCARITLDEETP